MTPSIRLAIDVLTSTACTAGFVVVLANFHTPVRSVLVLVALVIGCGWAVCGWMDLPEFAYAIALTIAAGISLSMAVSMVAVELKWWHPNATVGVVLLLAAILNIAQTLGSLRRKA